MATAVNDIDGKVMHVDLLNPKVREVQYAVRGELYLRGQELKAEGREIIATNIGNPQALGMKPLTFNRQVMALVMAPFLLENDKVGELFPSDAIERAKRILEQLGGKGLGAYTDSRGCAGFREDVASFIEARDGFPANPEHIFLTDGASPAVKMCLQGLIRDERDAILVPIPQYPLYSASITALGGTLVGYYMDEANAWGMDFDLLKELVDNTRAEGKCVRGLVFINPGNPTGQVLTKEDLQRLAQFASDEKLVLMADEVYQENIYQSEKPFVSAKKALMEMGEPLCTSVELCSFHSISKGTPGECGLRGGYVELVNIDPETVKELYKLVSVNLCPNTTGQVAMSLVVNPPKPGDESYESYTQERSEELASMTRRAALVSEAFSTMEGFSCNPVEGAMYAFPKVDIPEKAMEAAEAVGKPADTFYCLNLLEATGIITVPGSGFGQIPGTHHLRTTILPREEVMEGFVDKFKTFHEEFRAEYS
eukprot:evm.model.scf_2660.3 EVM.evm.TU.scf_2660.3   scf_2660:14056-20696(-)